DKHGLVLGAMDGIRYKETNMQLEPGDTLFVYTDGVPEANDIDNQQFGMERTLQSLTDHKDLPMEDMLKAVKVDIDKFTKGAPPFDDMTMLALRYEQNLVTEGVTVTPDMDNFQKVMSYVEETLEKAQVTMKQINKVSLVVDELFTNQVSYSEAEWVQFICRVDDEKIELYLRDNGVPYNPLEAAEPDITSDAEDRPIGGLGIFLSRKMMDDMSYHYVNGINVVKAMLKR
ncbi:MAG: SpoIIE family protein phosphatase, partial [Lachnospiraceae bacterium]|nr:SpoIIE family protein phosphatase [Candidatus Equihabitans merdae]